MDLKLFAATVSLKTIFSSKVGSWMSVRLGSVKEEIAQLKNEFEEKSQSLQAAFMTGLFWK